jgi:hypothetical protein
VVLGVGLDIVRLVRVVRNGLDGADCVRATVEDVEERESGRPVVGEGASSRRAKPSV